MHSTVFLFELSLITQIDELKHEIDAMQASMATMADERAQLEQRVDALVAALGQEQSAATEAAQRLSAELTEAMMKRAAMEEAVTQLQDRLAAKEAACSVLAIQSAALQERIDDMQTTHARELATQRRLQSEAVADMAAQRDRALEAGTDILQRASTAEAETCARLAATGEALEQSMARCEAIVRTSREKQQRIDELEAAAAQHAADRKAAAAALTSYQV